MKVRSINVFFILFNIAITLHSVILQQPETEAQLPIIRSVSTNTTVLNSTYTSNSTVTILKPVNETESYQRRNVIIQVKTVTKPSTITAIYMSMIGPIKHMLSAPKVVSVMKNVATCVVNGAVELISYYFPAPLIPIIASAAGMMIPFEPVLMLRDKLPVTSYRRAFMTALNTFLGTFDKYKLNDNDEYDPYMTQRFNRRMMNYGSVEKSASTILKTRIAATKPRPSARSFLAAVDDFLKDIRKEDQDDANDYDTRQRYNWKMRNH